MVFCYALHMVSPCDGDEDREKAIVALLHAHNADINAQDGEVSFCTCALFHRKRCKHVATRQRLSYSNPVCIWNASATLCNVKTVFRRLS